MLELSRGERNHCTLTLDDLRIPKIRKALVVYFRELGLPKSIAGYVVRQTLYSKGRGVRLYRLTTTKYIFVNYWEGKFIVGTEDQVFDRVSETRSWQQTLLWIEMAEHAAQGRRMTYREICDFIYETETDLKGIELDTKNVAPLESRKRRRKRKQRTLVVRKPSGYTWDEIRQASTWLGPAKSGSLRRKA